LGWSAVIQGDHEQAMERYEEALAWLRDAGLENLPYILADLGLTALQRGELDRATEVIEEALVYGPRMGDTATVIRSIEVMSMVAGSRGKPVRAASLWGAAKGMREDIGWSLTSDERVLYEPHVTAARSRMDEAAWEAALDEGTAMRLGEAVEYALSEEPSSTPMPALSQQPSADGVPTLSRREEEIAILVARGLTNRQIAAELSISEHTAATHVRRILKKLGLQSRAQIGSWLTHQKP
jgi:serine/threonine-protein kinase PknK